MIKIEALHKSYQSRAGAVTAVDGVDLRIHRNEFVSIIGPTGCGKTTVLKMVAGLVKPTSGTILVDDSPVDGPTPGKIAIVFQNFALLPWESVLGNVCFPLHDRGLSKAEAREAGLEALDQVGLRDFQRHYPHELSGGMQQRVGLARAFAVKPDVLLMDEPFGALDAQTRRVLQQDLLELWQREEKTVLFVTHAMEEAVYLSDRVVIMSPRPGVIQEIVDIPFGRPRDPDEIRKDPRYLEYQNYIWEALVRGRQASEEPVAP